MLGAIRQRSNVFKLINWEMMIIKSEMYQIWQIHLTILKLNKAMKFYSDIGLGKDIYQYMCMYIHMYRYTHVLINAKPLG
jgi:hypothetical protein